MSLLAFPSLRSTGLALGALGLAAGASAQTTYTAENNLVVIEFESSTIPGDWEESTSTPGFVGDGYIVWEGVNLFNSPGAQGIFGFDFEVFQGGNYRMNLRNRHEDPDPTEENDVWVRMDGGQWVKTFSNMAGSVGAWTWETRFDFDIGNQPDANYNLSPGLHRIEFSGRSNGFKMDRVHLYRPGTPGSLDQNQPESPSRVGTGYCVANSNSTGVDGLTLGLGSSVARENDLTLRAINVPANQFGIFIVSDAEGFTPNLAGTQGNLCIGGGLGRYDQILATGPAGEVEQAIDITSIPRPSTTDSAQASERWNWQFWHRDTPAAGGANLSRALGVRFQ